jgi:hypothetical protein
VHCREVGGKGSLQVGILRNASKGDKGAWSVRMKSGVVYAGEEKHNGSLSIHDRLSAACDSPLVFQKLSRDRHIEH